MNSTLDCIPCLTRQALEAVRFATADAARQESALRHILRQLGETDLLHSPPKIAQAMHRFIRARMQVEDPYRAIKDRFNHLALNLLGEYEAMVHAAPDPLITAARMATAANVIDLGANGALTEDVVRQSMSRALEEPLEGDLEAFREAAMGARSILILHDNAGEIVFDRLLVDQLSHARITGAVRGAPVLNDATLEDARAAGLAGRIEVIENGSDAPGTLLDECSADFLRVFHAADLIIAKGQGNFETLSDCRARIAFLFKAKCLVVSRRLNVPPGTQVIRLNGEAR